MLIKSWNAVHFKNLAFYICLCAVILLFWYIYHGHRKPQELTELSGSDGFKDLNSNTNQKAMVKETPIEGWKKVRGKAKSHKKKGKGRKKKVRKHKKNKREINIKEEKVRENIMEKGMSQNIGKVVGINENKDLKKPYEEDHPDVDKTKNDGHVDEAEDEHPDTDRHMDDDDDDDDDDDYDEIATDSPEEI